MLWSNVGEIVLNGGLIMSALKSDFWFTLSASVNRLLDVGPVPSGTRHVDLLGPGTFEGPRLRGELLPGGLDMKTIRADGAEIVDASEYYHRSTPYFETSSPQYAWLNRIVAVGLGWRKADRARYEVFEIL